MPEHPQPNRVSLVIALASLATAIISLLNAHWPF